MARKYRDVRNTGFRAGVIAPEFQRDPNLFKQSLKTGLNVFLTNAGSILRRPGSFIIRNITGEIGGTLLPSGRFNIKQFDFEPGDNVLRHAFFTAGEVNIYNTSGILEATLAGPWGDDDLYSMAIVDNLDEIYIVSQSFPTQTISRDPLTGNWSIAAYTFATDPSGRRSSPFERFLDGNITLTPSGYTGNITADFSEGFLTNDYVGVHFQVAFGAQIEILTVLSPTQATANVKGNIYPTQAVTVANGAPYVVGDIISGDTTSARGQVVAKAGNVLTVVNTDGFTLFQGPMTSGGATVPGENLVGPNGSSTVVSAVQAATPSGTNIWFEEIVSPARGYPGAATLHRDRLVFGGFPQLPNYIVASATRTTNDFDVGDSTADDAIIEAIGNNTQERVLHLVSAEQLIVLTDRRALYVPEQANQRFTPTDIEFDNIGPEIAGFQQPEISSEGVLFIDNKDRVILLSITGSNRGTWRPQELTRLGYEHLKKPQQILFSTGIKGRTERVLSVLNDDGSLAVFTYPRGAEQGGWVPWQRERTYSTVGRWNARMYCVSSSKSFDTFEEIDFGAVIDAQFTFGTFPIEPLGFYHRLEGQHVTGLLATNNFGTFDGEVDNEDVLGDDFAVCIEPVPFANENVGRLLRRIYEVQIDVLQTGTYRVDGELCQSYDYQTNVDAPPPVTTRMDEVHLLGSTVDATVKIEQVIGEGAPLHIREITLLTRGG